MLIFLVQYRISNKHIFRQQELLTVSFLLSTRTSPTTHQQRPTQALRGGGVRSTSSQANVLRKTIGCTPVTANLLVDPASANSHLSTTASTMLAALMWTTPPVGAPSPGAPTMTVEVGAIATTVESIRLWLLCFHFLTLNPLPICTIPS